MESVGGLARFVIGIGEVYRDNNIRPIYRETIIKNIEDFVDDLLGDG